MKDIPKNELAKKAKEGEVLFYDGDKITISKEETDKLKKEIDDLMNELFEN